MRDALHKGVGAVGQTSLGEENAAKPPLDAPNSGPDSVRRWVEAHAKSIDQYNTWALLHEPYSQRVKRWRDEAIRAA